MVVCVALSRERVVFVVVFVINDFMGLGLYGWGFFILVFCGFIDVLVWVLVFLLLYEDKNVLGMF